VRSHLMRCSPLIWPPMQIPDSTRRVCQCNSVSVTPSSAMYAWSLSTSRAAVPAVGVLSCLCWRAALQSWSDAGEPKYAALKKWSEKFKACWRRSPNVWLE
jgi:hypothetical protein